VEADRLSYIENHQEELRVETYAGLADHLERRAKEQNVPVGRLVVLPSSFTGGDRYMTQVFQDAMALVRDKGKPTFFFTFTCNPKWHEIVESLAPGQTAIDRPNIVAVVFHEKWKALLKELVDDQVLGKVAAWTYSIEFQKRLLPHAHCLIIMEDADRVYTAEDVDAVVNAEIPCPNRQGTLRALVEAHMMHGPCGRENPQAPCIGGVGEGASTCNKNYPKDFADETEMGEDAYPTYKRRDNGMPVTRGQAVLDNRHVVPYNPYLLQKYACHANMEVCASIKSVKYIYKYIFKGHDSAHIHVQRDGAKVLDQNGVQEYLNGRYVGSVEACWRLFKFEVQQQSHTVCRLPLHLPNEENVYF
jgi:hypothetical protein